MNLKTLSLLYEKVTFVLRVQRYVKFLFLQTFLTKISQLFAKNAFLHQKPYICSAIIKRYGNFNEKYGPTCGLDRSGVRDDVGCIGSIISAIHSLGMGFRHYPRGRWQGVVLVRVCQSRQGPVVIDQVNVSCGCTTPEFSRKPIKAGERGVLKVTFDPANRAGEFAKEITVFTGGRRYRTTLRITGNIIARTKTVEELYPTAVGDCGLRIDARSLPFNYVTQSERKNLFINYINTSSKPIRVRLAQTSASGFMRHDFPQTIAAGAKGRVTFSYSVPRSSGYFGELRDVFEVQVEGAKAMFEFRPTAMPSSSSKSPTTNLRQRPNLNANCLNSKMFTRAITPRQSVCD